MVIVMKEEYTRLIGLTRVNTWWDRRNFTFNVCRYLKIAISTSWVSLKPPNNQMQRTVAPVMDNPSRFISAADLERWAAERSRD
jgi:hypothetical protein